MIAIAYAETQKRISLDADASIGIYTGVPGTRGAAAPNSGRQFRFVKITGEHIGGLSTNAANEMTVGVLQNKPQVVGTGAEIAISGVTMLQVGSGGLTAGQGVKSDANGQGINATLGTDGVLAVVIKGATAGALATVLLHTSK